MQIRFSGMLLAYGDQGGKAMKRALARTELGRGAGPQISCVTAYNNPQSCPGVDTLGVLITGPDALAFLNQQGIEVSRITPIEQMARRVQRLFKKQFGQNAGVEFLLRLLRYAEENSERLKVSLPEPH